ncbi:MAG: VacJ family lipoprotein [Desulfobulbaceae bacterium]|nr:VacJ family lipoprotein [Desulfobulbaceae bacterium]
MLKKNCAHKVLMRLIVLAVLVAAPAHLYAAGAVDFLDDASYEGAEHFESIYDPLEPFNRVMFTFNDRLYLWVIDPVATGYSKVVPTDFRTIISNFFYNLGEPVRSVNCLLQGRLADSGLVLSRFLINSTAGVFGLADPAGNEFKIKRVYASLGQTFSVWGIGDGVYLVVPILGPSTLRDLTGSVGDGFARGLYTPWSDDFSTTSAIYGSQTINEVSLRLGQYQDMKAISLDPYVAFRNGYFQLRQKSPRTGHVGEFPALTPPDINYQQ